MKFAFYCESSVGLGELVEPSVDWVVVNLSPKRVAALREQLKLADQIGQVDPKFKEMQFKTNEVQVYHYILELNEKGFENAANEILDKGWAVLPEDLDLARYQPLELKSKRFCVRPAQGELPATFYWMIHIEGEMGPGRTEKWRLEDLEQALAEASQISQKQSTLDIAEACV